MTEMDGTGLYIRGLSKSKHGTPEQAAKKAADHGVSNVAIMSVWQDYKDGRFRHLAGNLRNDRFLPYAEAFEKHGIAVGLWFYPWGGHETQLLDDLQKACEDAPINFLLDDGELGHKWKTGRAPNRNDVGTMRGGQSEAIHGVPVTGTKRKRIAQVKTLYKGLVDIRDNVIGNRMNNFGIGVTSYGIAKYHPTFPWEVKLPLADFCSPQLYTATPAQVDAGIQQWYDHSKGQWNKIPMLPSIGTFGKRSEGKMHGHLSTFVDGEERVDGFFAWSWRQTSKSEWNTLARWADWLKRGACRL